MLCTTTFEDIARRHGSRWLGREKTLHSAKTLNNKHNGKYAGQKDRNSIRSIPSRGTTDEVGYLGASWAKSAEKLNYCYSHFEMFHFTCINQVHNVHITNKLHFNVYYVSYSLYSQQHISADIAAIFRVVLLLEYKSTNVISSVAVVTQYQLKITIISVKII